MFIQILCSFCNWVICLFLLLNVRVLHIFWMQLTRYVICKYFLTFEGCLFVLFMVSFAVQKVLSLIRSHLFIFYFIFIILGGGSKNILLQYMPESVLPMFFSTRVTVTGLTIRSSIHFVVILVYDIREYSNFILLHVDVQFSQHNLLKSLSFLHCTFLLPLS